MEVYVARQPIFTRSKEVFGYELLFRDGISSCFPEDIDGDQATSEVLSTSFLTMGIDRVVGNRKAFVNFTEPLLIR